MDAHRHKRALELFAASLDQPDSTRDAWLVHACGDDAELLHQVSRMLQADRLTDNGLATGQVAVNQPSPIPEHVGPYRVTALLGQGGMGSVYRAERADGAFQREVAIKFMHQNLLDGEATQRFTNERQILAGMRHPNIAQLLDGGTEAGVPYLVLEYIDGTHLGYDGNRTLAATLMLFIKACRALQFAHNNFVLHRDIKPSNIMVTADGDPKLLDFGVAKLSQDLSHLQVLDVTGVGVLPLTPGYAAPERFLGDPATVASDVYSLGVVLYEVLHNAKPFDVRGLTPPEAHRVLTQSSVTCNTGSEDVDLILTQALHPDIERRYATVAQLAEDLQRVLDGRPISARSDDLTYLFKRFVQRNKALVVASCVGLVVVLVALGATGWAYLRAEDALRESAQRFNQVRSLANSLMFDVYDEVEAVSGTTQAQRMLATTAQSYLDELSKTKGAELEVRIDAARGYARLGQLYDTFAGASLGEADQSEQALDRAGSIYAQLLAEYPGNKALYTAAGDYYYDRGGRWLYKQQKPEMALEILNQALRLYREAEREAVDDIEIFAKRVAIENRIADSHKWAGDNALAREILERSLVAVESRLTQHPNTPRLLELSGLTHAFVAEVRTFTEDLEGAIEAYEGSLARYRAFAGDSPNHQTERRLAITSWLLGRAFGELERFEEAVAATENALSLVEQHVAKDATDLDAARSQAIMRGSLADVLAKMGRTEQALSIMQQSNGWFEAQAEADPNSPRKARMRVVGYQVMADIYADANQMTPACEWWRKTHAAWTHIDETWGLTGFDQDEPAKVLKLLEQCL